MERPSRLTDLEQAFIVSLFGAGKTQVAIAREICRTTRNVVLSYLRSISTYGINEPEGRPQKVS